jgi:hypothetical protein
MLGVCHGEHRNRVHFDDWGGEAATQEAREGPASLRWLGRRPLLLLRLLLLQRKRWRQLLRSCEGVARSKNSVLSKDSFSHRYVVIINISEFPSDCSELGIRRTEMGFAGKLT